MTKFACTKATRNDTLTTRIIFILIKISSVRKTFSAEFKDDCLSDVSVMEEEGEEWTEESLTDVEDNGSSDDEEMDDNEEEEEESSDDEEDLDVLVPIPKRRMNKYFSLLQYCTRVLYL